MSGDFLQQSYFISTKDRVIRSLRTFFESRRADSHAVYYRDALLSSRDNGIEESLAIAQSIDFQKATDHYKRIVQNHDVFIECLFSGNVSTKEAKNFFYEARAKIEEAQAGSEFGMDEIVTRPPPGEDNLTLRNI